MESVKRGIPRWLPPIDPSKIRTAPAPPSMFEQLESITAVMPMGEPAISVGEMVPKPVTVKAVRKTGATVTGAAVPVEGKERTTRIRKEIELPATIGELPEGLKDIAARIEINTQKDRILVHQDAFVPSNRRAFKQFIIQAFRRYALPKVSDIPDPDACAKAVADSKKETKAFAYQAFVRDFIQRPTPYRGMLVYHGLGAGKTGASILAAEALELDGQKPVFIMTPASLDPNYREEITKYGPIVFRTMNFWTWIPIASLKPTPPPEAVYAVKTLGIPIKLIEKQRGVWLPDPAKKPNFDMLTAEERRDIKKQIAEHIDNRYKFVHYNGLQEAKVRSWACDETRRNRFDGSVIVIDEVHNLIRSINNSGLEDFYKQEPRDLAEYIPRFCNTGQRYRVSYLFYRILCNAVGCKIIALSATPIINFPQEVAVLANLLGGDTRMVEVNSPGLANQKQFLDILQKHPEVDFAEVIPRPELATSTIRITPVPSGCRKVLDEATGAFRGFIRHEHFTAEEGEIARERALEGWFVRVKEALTAAKLPELGEPKYSSVTRLPDTERVFRELFIDEEKLVVKEEVKLVLMARLSGLVSYYKGGKADLMARVNSDTEVFVDMSSLQLKKYTEQRKIEIDRELSDKKKKPAATGHVSYEDATKNQVPTFKIFSRAACNFVFPADMERPVPADYRDQLKMIGAKQGAPKADGEDADFEVVAEDGIIVDERAEAEQTGDGAAVAGAAVPVAAAAAAAAAAVPPTTYEVAVVNAVKEIKARAPEIFALGRLAEISPKFQAIIDNLATSKGPALVYSNFLTLEGVGIFGVALETQVAYRKLDIVPIAGSWALTPETLAAGPGTPRYIMYTGNETREKKQILLNIFNGKWNKIPGALAEQVQALTGTKTNIHGDIARVFMITASGAEGISLSNVRQVHIMEAYWNYVRLDQVKGRAIRICSHMDLPPEERSVDVFTYVTKFSAEQLSKKEVDETLMNFDNGETSDQTILNLLKAKKKLADSVVDIMKQAAIDCELNATENGTVACYRFAGDPSMEHLYHPLVSVHLSEGRVRARA